MSGLENTSKELAEDYSDSDCNKYKFQEEQQQIKVAQKEVDFTINKWRSLKSLNPQGMDLNVWLSIHCDKGLDVTENKQRNDLRALESKEMTPLSSLHFQSLLCAISLLSRALISFLCLFSVTSNPFSQ